MFSRTKELKKKKKKRTDTERMKESLTLRRIKDYLSSKVLR